jgi:hypothetical protein
MCPGMQRRGQPRSLECLLISTGCILNSHEGQSGSFEQTRSHAKFQCRIPTVNLLEMHEPVIRAIDEV